MQAAAKFKKSHGRSFTCLALVKTNSNIAREWKLTKPAYCIFEYSAAFAEVIIKWGDGSWQVLKTSKQLDDLILLEQFGEKEIDQLFNH